MGDTIIKVENLNKKFVIGHQSPEKYTALRDVLANGVRGTLRKAKDLISGKQIIDGDYSEDFWALKDINFEIKQGDRVGIIGRNGAGKSTLLKVISRITEPTQGRIIINGRIASLLEVGTGFHPELTGRENIFLNGAILGMSRAEIRGKFDEIVAFAEVEKFLDTPVKRYSSGMYVRLAFAVAAHLEPEILIVDEVLAVGDVRFQKKCLGKMEDVSKNHGRTVLFVSHNMGIISSFCEKSILLNMGKLEYMGSVDKSIDKYLNQQNLPRGGYINKGGVKANYIKSVDVLNKDLIESENFMSDENIFIRIGIIIREYSPVAKISISLQNMVGELLSTIVEDIAGNYVEENQGIVELLIKLPAGLITPNSYAFRVAIFVPFGKEYDLVEMICPIRIVDNGSKMAIFEGLNYGSFNMEYELIKQK